MNKLKSVCIFFCTSLLLFFGGNAAAAGGDPSGGQCAGLDPSSGLFPTCIQAYSCANRIEHLIAVGANQTAVAKAKACLDEAILTYSQLPGGGIIPGFAPPAPLIAIAYINRDAVPGYNASNDTLVAKLVGNFSNGICTGCKVITDKYPINYEGGEASFGIKTHNIMSVYSWVSGAEIIVRDEFNGYYLFRHRVEFDLSGNATGINERYEECDAACDANLTSFFDFALAQGNGVHNAWIQARLTSPSNPEVGVENLYPPETFTNGNWLEVELFF